MFGGFDFDFLEIAVTVLALLISVVLHEVSHGYVAYLCGDPTAKNAGRLSLNPLKHLDPFGSIILPALLLFMNAPVFAYAKPVPYDPRYLRHRRRDELLVALSGPASNLVQALVGAGLWQLLWHVAPEFTMDGFGWYLADFLLTFVYVNLILMFFNLIPIPPLDGSAIIGWFMPPKALRSYYKVQQYSMPILIGLFFLVPLVFHWDPVFQYIQATAVPIYSWLCFT